LGKVRKVMQTEQDGWITLAEAAKALDCSIDTIRRKLKRGEIEGQLQNTRHGKLWLVSLGSISSIGTDSKSELIQPMQNRQEAAEPAQAIESEPEQGIVELVRLVTQLQEETTRLNQEVVDRTEAASIWQGRAEMLSLQLNRAQDTIKALEAPKVEEKPKSWWRIW
jgi:hypothetical protein